MSNQYPPNESDDERREVLGSEGLGTGARPGDSPFDGEPPLGAGPANGSPTLGAGPSATQPASNQWQPATPAPAAPVHAAPGANGFGIAALVLGIVGLAVCWIPFFGFSGVVIGIVGVALGIAGLVLQRYRGMRPIAVVGTALSSLALLLSTFLPFITGVFYVIDRLDRNGTFDRMDQEWEHRFETRFDTWDEETTGPTLEPSPTAPETYEVPTTEPAPGETATPAPAPTPTP